MPRLFKVFSKGSQSVDTGARRSFTIRATGADDSGRQYRPAMVEQSLPPGIEVGLSDGDRDLDGILALQRRNLESSLSPADVAASGFVTVVHTRAILDQLHRLAPSIVARAGGEVVGYAIAMALSCRPLVPALEPMFRLLEGLTIDGRPLLSFRCYVMGQVCVARELRGRGVFDALYASHRTIYGSRYDFLVTDVAVRNARSMRAHLRVGFRELVRYRDEEDEWSTVALDLRSPAP
jgi:hypothetical protein